MLCCYSIKCIGVPMRLPHPGCVTRHAGFLFSFFYLVFTMVLRVIIKIILFEGLLVGIIRHRWKCPSSCIVLNGNKSVKSIKSNVIYVYFQHISDSREKVKVHIEIHLHQATKFHIPIILCNVFATVSVTDYKSDFYFRKLNI